MRNTLKKVKKLPKISQDTRPTLEELGYNMNPDPREHPNYTVNMGRNEFPQDGRDAWGARWVFPDDYLSDRSSFASHRVSSKIDPAEHQRLLGWLNSEPWPILKARQYARNLADTYRMVDDENQTYTLYEDAKGIIIGNPQSSFGYLYVCGYLKTKENKENQHNA